MSKIIQVAIMPRGKRVGEVEDNTGTIVVLTDGGRLFSLTRDGWQEIPTDRFEHDLRLQPGPNTRPEPIPPAQL